MINLLDIDDVKLNQTTQGIKNQAKLRGWSVALPYVGSPHFFIDRGHGDRLHIFSTTPPGTSFAAAHLANDKFATYNALMESGIKQLDTILVDTVDDDIASVASSFLDKHEKIVVKPIDGGHGKGITVNVSSIEALERAVGDAVVQNKNGKKVLLQEQYLHDAIYDLRLTCIGYKYVAATMRVPARVYGDGLHSIRELIEIENSSEKRGEPYYADLATISVVGAEKFLGNTIHSIPAVNAEVQVLGVANYGAGGETVDYTDETPSWLREMAERAASTCSLPVCGVDFMVSAIPNKNISISELDAVLIEINKCPSLAIHDYPTHGTARSTIACYMDYLAQLP